MNITLQELAYETISDYVECNLNDPIRSNYSGRGMYGKKCVAIVVDDQMEAKVAIRRITSSLLTQILDLVADNDECDLYPEEMIDLILDFQTDNMGLDTVLYWPQLQAPTEEV